VTSSTLFILAINWVMRNTTSDIPRGIRWGTFSILEDLGFAGDIALLSHSHLHIQSKTNRLNKYAGHIGLKTNTTISKKDLLNRCQQEDMATIITKRCWKWIENVLRKEPDDITKTALYWTPEGKRKRGRPKITW
jgi:hypothetical protein